MIISHKYKFIFFKTVKTAGTSLEVFLSSFCDDNDVLTPIIPRVEPHEARNHRGFWNPMSQILPAPRRCLAVLKRLLKRKKFYNHMAAWELRAIVPPTVWNNYFKFCVERNPWDKAISDYHMVKDRGGRSRTFDQYIRNGRFPINYPIYTDRNGSLMVDEVLRYESLTDGLGRVFGKLGIPFEGTLGVAAKSEHRKDRRAYQEVYTEKQRDIIARAFAREIEMNGYTF